MEEPIRTAIDKEVGHLREVIEARLDALDKALELQAGKDALHFQSLNNAEERALKVAENTVTRREMTTEIDGLRDKLTAETQGVRTTYSSEINGLRDKLLTEIEGLKKNTTSEINGVKDQQNTLQIRSLMAVISLLLSILGWIGALAMWLLG